MYMFKINTASYFRHVTFFDRLTSLDSYFFKATVGSLLLLLPFSTDTEQVEVPLILNTKK